MEESLVVALKEWAYVVAALQAGRQILLFRKGGILDKGGVFEPEHSAFWLYPTLEHQHSTFIRPEYLDGLRLRSAGFKQGDKVACQFLARVVRTWALPVETHSAKVVEALMSLSSYHVYHETFFEQRLRYRPERPLYMLAVRVFSLPSPVSFLETSDYAGCKSWVHLKEAMALSALTPVLSETDFQNKMKLLEKEDILWEKCMPR